MKYFNTGLVARAKKIEPFLLLLLPIRLLLTPIALLLRLRTNRIDIFVGDGFLVGDTALIRPLLAACVATHKSLVYLGGMQGKTLLADIPLIHYYFQWPWATYQYSLIAFVRLVKLWLYLFLSQPKTVIEIRGDLRNLAIFYLACPRLLYGYSFTGGKFLLDAEPQHMDEFFHLEIHHQELAYLCLLNYKVEDFFVKQKLRPQPKYQIALSFAGSLKLKTLPAKLGRFVIEKLQLSGIELIYLKAPLDRFLTDSDVLKETGVTIWKGDFNSYVKTLSQVSGYIGVDSGGSHIAAMYQIPELLFFGTQFPSFCAPLPYPGQQILETELNLSCRPCAGVICANSKFQACYETIYFEKIEKALDTFIQDVKKHYQSNKVV